MLRTLLALALLGACSSTPSGTAPDGATSAVEDAGAPDAAASLDMTKIGPSCPYPFTDAGPLPESGCGPEESCVVFNLGDAGLHCSGPDPCAAVTCEPGWRCFHLGSFPSMVTCMR